MCKYKFTLCIFSVHYYLHLCFCMTVETVVKTFAERKEAVPEAKALMARLLLHFIDRTTSCAEESRTGDFIKQEDNLT